MILIIFLNYLMNTTMRIPSNLMLGNCFSATLVSLMAMEGQAINSSGSSITPYLMLLITLRMLAGASYLEMILYHVHVDSVHSIVWETDCAVTKNINNIHVATSEGEFLRLEKEWSDIQRVRW